MPVGARHSGNGYDLRDKQLVLEIVQLQLHVLQLVGFAVLFHFPNTALEGAAVNGIG